MPGRGPGRDRGGGLCVSELVQAAEEVAADNKINKSINNGKCTPPPRPGLCLGLYDLWRGFQEEMSASGTMRGKIQQLPLGHSKRFYLPSWNL